MTSVRDQRAAAIRRNWRDLQDDLRRALPRLLDDLDAIDRHEFAERNGISDGLAATLANMTQEEWAQQGAARGFLQALAEPSPAPEVPAAEPAEAAQENTEPRAPTDAEISAWIDAHPAEYTAWVRKRDRIEGTGPARTASRRRTTPKAGA